MEQEEFQLHVVDSLARLETKMTDLIGNGKLGRVGTLERSVERLKKFAWLIGGALVTISAIIHFVFRY
jgi:hypothetical protein